MSIFKVSTNAFVGHTGAPREIEVQVISEKRNCYYVEIIDERTPAGKRIFTNTDTFGTTNVIDKNLLTNKT